jgi:hypothetical protein
MKESRLFSRTTRKTNFFLHFSLTMVVSFLLLCVSQNVQALTKPTLQSPANNAQITTSSITFSWSHPYNDKYEVKIKSSGGTLQYASGKISSKSKTVNLSSIPLTSGSTYKWYVVVYANGQEISSSDSWFTYKSAVSAPVVQQKPVVSGRVDLSGGVNVSPSSVTVGQNFTVSFNLKEFQGGTKTLEYVQLWIQNSAGGDLYTAQQWSKVSFAANQQRSFSATTSLNSAQGRSAGTYRAVVRGKVAGEAPFNFGVVSGSGGINPRTFTAVAAASPPSPSPSQPQPSVPAPAVQPKPIVSGRVDLGGGVNVSPSSVTVGQNFTVSFNLKEFQGGTKTFEYVQLWIQNSAGDDLYSAQQWSNVAFAANQQRSFSAATSLNPSQGRGAGTYRAIIRGKVAGEAPFNFGVVSGSGGVNPRTFTAVATVSPPPYSPSQPQPGKPPVSTSVDQQKPVVSGFDVIKVGNTNTVSIAYRVTDSGGSGLKQVELWRSSNNRDWAEITNKRRLLSGNGPVSGSFTDIPPSAGTYYYGIHVVDQAGNWDSENGPKNITVRETTQSYGSVSGRLHRNSASGAVLSGVSVIGGGRHVITDGNGYFKLERISAGNNSVSFTKSGFEPYQATLNVPAGETLDVGDRWLVEKGVSSNPISSSKSVFPLPDNFKLSNYNGRGLCDYKNKFGKWHTGIDIPTRNVEPAVKAVCKGKIIINNTNRVDYKTKYEKYWNAFVVINHDCDEDGEFESFGYYGHLISNKYGSIVAKGEIIGSIRMAYKENDIPNPGNNHLHFGYNKNRKDDDWGYFGNTCDDVKKAGWEDPIHNFKLD